MTPIELKALQLKALLLHLLATDPDFCAAVWAALQPAAEAAAQRVAPPSAARAVPAWLARKEPGETAPH